MAMLAFEIVPVSMAMLAFEIVPVSMAMLAFEIVPVSMAMCGKGWKGMSKRHKYLEMKLCHFNKCPIVRPRAKR